MKVTCGSQDDERNLKHGVRYNGTLQRSQQGPVFVSNEAIEIHTTLTSRKMEALTTAGFRVRYTVLHNAGIIKRADGMIERNTCSKSTLKSNCLLFCSNSEPFGDEKGIPG